MPKLNLAPGKTAQFYNLMSEHFRNRTNALNEVIEKSYDEINKETNLGEIVDLIKEGFEKYFLDGEKLDMNYFTGKNENYLAYFIGFDEKIAQNIVNEEDFCDKIIKVIDEAHEKWIVKNASKFSKESEKNLMKYLPCGLTSPDINQKFFMTLSPIMDQIGYRIGEMDETLAGKFRTTKMINEAYQRFVQNYKDQHGINSKEDLKNHISSLVEKYSVRVVGKNLDGTPQTKIDYYEVKQKVDYLFEKVIYNNVNAFYFDFPNEHEK